MKSAKTSPSDLQQVVAEWTGHAAARRARNRELLELVCLTVACLIFIWFLAGCTVAPKVVSDQVASFDGNAQNSGFIGFDSAGAGIITPHARDRYNALIAIYGSRFVPPLASDAGISPTAANTFLIDAEHLTDFAIMNHWRKQTLSPTK